MTEAVRHGAAVVDGPRGAKHGRVPLDDVMRIFIRKPGFLLARIDQIADALYASHGAGETLAQAEMLLAIAVSVHGDQISLARACGIDTSTTAIILDNLQSAGLIARVQDQHDRRRSLPALTDAGMARMISVRRAFAALQAELLAGLAPAQRDELVHLLGTMVRAHNGPAPPLDTASSPFVEAPSFLCRRALQISVAHFAQCLAPLLITLRQFSALVILHLHPDLSQVEFARAFGLDPSTCAVILKNLAARGDLTAQRSRQDRRKTLYATTAQGSDLAAHIQPLVDRSEVLARTALDEAQVGALLAALQAIVRHHSARLRFPGCLPW